MGIFGDDKLQDERIAALESHVRMLTETVQANQADLAEGRIAILKLQAQVLVQIEVPGQSARSRHRLRPSVP